MILLIDASEIHVRLVESNDGVRLLMLRCSIRIDKLDLELAFRTQKAFYLGSLRKMKQTNKSCLPLTKNGHAGDTNDVKGIPMQLIHVKGCK